MSVDKAVVKAAMVAEIGKGLEERVEACRREVARREGARAGLIEAAQKIQNYMSSLNDKVDDGEIGMEEQKMMRDAARHIFGIIDNLATSQEIALHRASGSLAEAERTAAGVHKLWVGLDAKAAALEAHEENGLITGPRPAGAKPAPSIASRRKAAREKKEPEDAQSSAREEQKGA